MKRILLLCLFLTSCDFPKVVSSNFSRELCSCLFVTKQSSQYCQAYAKQWLPPWKYEILEQEKAVVSSQFFHQTKAIFVSKKFGCQIQGSPVK